MIPWDQRAARVLVRPLVHSPVTPNQLTFFTLLLALVGVGLFAVGDLALSNWGAGLFALGALEPHQDAHPGAVQAEQLLLVQRVR